MRRLEHTIGSRMAGLMRLACLLLLSAMSTVVLLSCGGSGDEPGGTPTPQPQPNTDIPIAFSGNLSESQSETHARTRATGTPLSATHGTIYVWAYKNMTSTTETVMQNYKVDYVSGSAGTTTSNSSGWEYVNHSIEPQQSIKYWDFDADAYRFFGYAGPITSDADAYPAYSSTPGLDNVMISFKVDVTKVVSGNPVKDPVSMLLKDGTTPRPLYSKLWYKGHSDLPAQKNKPVTLEFLQPYTKVRFMFRQSEPETTTFVLSEMKFRPTPPTGSGTQKEIATAGIFTVTYPMSGATKEEWNVPSVTATLNHVTEGEYQGFTQNYYVAAADEIDPDIIAGEKMWYVVLPAKDQGTYTLSLKLNGVDKSVVVPAKYMEWQPSYEYTYIFKITEAGGVEIDAVQSAFTPWVSHEYRDNDENPDMYEVHNW